MNCNKKTLFSLLLGLDLLANILEVTHVNFLGISTLLSFCTCILLPGLLISLILRIRKISFWENLVIIVGLSIAFLEFGGLFLNILLPLFGVNDPLAFQNLVFGFDIYVLLLFIFAWIRTKQFVIQIQLPRRSKIEKLLYALAVCFPILATLGAIILNNGGSNILLLILLGTIAFYCLLLVILRDKISVDLYPYAIFFIGLACLFTTSLRSWYISGHDIEKEFYVFLITNAHHMWNTVFFQDPYNACLSITILPTILTNLLSIQDMYVYKVIFQILFATSPVLVFFILKNYTTPVFAFLSAVLYMSFPTFFNDMPMLNRQEIGFIFFGLALYMMLKRDLVRQFYKKLDTHSLSAHSFDISRFSTRFQPVFSPDVSKLDTLSLSARSLDLSKLETRSLSLPSQTDPLPLAGLSQIDQPSVAELSIGMRRILFIIFAIGIIVSHYSTNFVLLALMVFVYLTTQVTSLPFVKKALAFLISMPFIKQKNTFTNKVFIGLPLIFLLFGITFFWNTIYTKTSSHSNSVISEVINSIFVGSNNKSGDISYSLFFSSAIDPRQQLQAYIQSLEQNAWQGAKNPGNTGQFFSQSVTDKYPSYPVEQEQLAPTPLGNLLSSLHIPVFDVQSELRSLAASLIQVFVFIGLLAVFLLKNKKPLDRQYLFLCGGAVLLLALITLLPALSVEYGVLRMFQQLLFLLSLPIVLGLSSIFFFVKEQKRILFTGMLVIIFFLNLTGFISHLTGDYYPQMTLDNAGLYYDAYYVNRSDVVAIAWLSENNINHDPVDTDLTGVGQLETYGDILAANAIFPPLIQKNAYVFLGVSSNIVVSIAEYVIISNSPKPFLNNNKNLIYSNGEYNVYR